MTSWKGKSRGGVTGYKIFVAVLKYTGLAGAYFILRFVALWFFLSNPRSFSLIFSFYRKRMNYGFLKSVIFVYRNYYAFGQVLIDKIAVMSGSGKKFSFIFEGEEHLHRMAENKAGGILISGHTGNFEMAGYMLERIKARVNVVMYDEEYENIREYLSTVARRNFQVIPVGKDDNSHIFTINNSLKSGEIICIHGDRFIEGSKKMAVDFMGEKAYFPTGPFYLSMKFNVPVSFVFAMKESRYRYHFYATPGRYYSMPGHQQERDIILRSIIKDYIFEFEKVIMNYPAQWFNYYDFWEKHN